MTAASIHTIVIYPRPHVDTICAIFLLKTFGETHFPNIQQATIAYWNSAHSKTADEWEQEGYLLVDMGGGKFDHHHDTHETKKTDCASTLIAKFLGVDADPALRNVLQFAKRDDLEGRGIVSKDVLDRAFGLPAIIMNLNRDYPNHPDYVVEIGYRVFLSHYHEQYRRKVLMPQLWQTLQDERKATIFTISTPTRSLKVVMIESDEKALIGFLRAVKDVRADLVVQKTSHGHVNIVTRQEKPRLDLRPVISELRRAEAQAKGLSLTSTQTREVARPGRLDGVEEWYFDTAANTLQNGGAAPDGIAPTRLNLAIIKKILEQTLPLATPQKSVTTPAVNLFKLPPRPPRPPR